MAVVSLILFSMTMVTLVNELQRVLASPPTQRRHPGRCKGDRQEEWAAADRFQKVGLLDPLIDSLLIFFLCAHAETADSKSLMQLRKELRARHRPQAMGTSGVGVDLDLLLRFIIESKIGRTMDDVLAEFRQDARFSGWTEEDVLRMAFRRGLQVQAFPLFVVRWAYAAAISNP